MFHATIILGTRPEIIKLAPLLRLFYDQGIPHQLIHTNQHYSAELDSNFFVELKLKQPNHNLHIGPGTQAEQTARMLIGIDKILLEYPTSCVIVQGDTNSVLAGALSASKHNIPIVHLEAGLRSFDRTMPEEINRIITDSISDILLPPTSECAQNLLITGISPDLIHVVGNTIVDSVMQQLKLTTNIDLSSFGLIPKDYYLLTLHRPSNVDTKNDLEDIFHLLSAISDITKTTFFFPAHPRTRSNIERFNIKLPKNIILHAPIGYSECLAIEKNAKAIFTDSGGLQEEGCILGTPCLTLRNNTERPETVDVGANVLVHRDLKKALSALQEFEKGKVWENPFGDGNTCLKILDLIRTKYL